MLQVSPFRRRHRSGVQGIRSIAEPLDRAARGVRAVLRRVLTVTTQLEPVPTELLDLVEQLSSAGILLTADLPAERPSTTPSTPSMRSPAAPRTCPGHRCRGTLSSPRSSPRWSTCTKSPASTSTSRWPGCHPRGCPHPTPRDRCLSPDPHRRCRARRAAAGTSEAEPPPSPRPSVLRSSCTTVCPHFLVPVEIRPVTPSSARVRQFRGGSVDDRVAGL